MLHTITITLSDAAQRAAILSGEPAQQKQTYEVEPTLLARLLALPWTHVLPDGDASCIVPTEIGYGRSHEPDWHHTSTWGIWRKGAASTRPTDAAAAVEHGELVVAGYLAYLAFARVEEQREADEREASERARVDAWTRRPLSERVSHEGLLTCVPMGAGLDYEGPLSRDGSQIVAHTELERHAPEAYAEAMREVDRHRAVEAAAVRDRKAIEETRLRDLLVRLDASEALLDAYDAGVATDSEVASILRRTIVGDLPRLERLSGDWRCSTDEPEQVPSAIWVASRRVIGQLDTRAAGLGLSIDTRLVLRSCESVDDHEETETREDYAVEVRCTIAERKVTAKIAIPA